MAVVPVGVQSEVYAARLSLSEKSQDSLFETYDQNNSYYVIDANDLEKPVRFLYTANLSFEPTQFEVQVSDSGTWRPWRGQAISRCGFDVLGRFERYNASKWCLVPEIKKLKKSVRLYMKNERQVSSYFRKAVRVKSELSVLRNMVVSEAGEFGETLPADLRRKLFDRAKLKEQQESLVDPIFSNLDHELSWEEIEKVAYPLDHQKILLSGLHDPDPGFAYQNGQWFVTVPSASLGPSQKEDRWFVPSLRIADKLVVPAPLSAKTSWRTLEHGEFVPALEITWRVGQTILRERLSSEIIESVPQIVARFEVESKDLIQARPSAIVLGLGHRPSVHFWSGPYRNGPNLNYVALSPFTEEDWGDSIVDDQGHLVLATSSKLRVLEQGPLETLVEIPFNFFKTKADPVSVITPQRLVDMGAAKKSWPIAQTLEQSESRFVDLWTKEFARGASVRLPSHEWMTRIQSWLYQSLAIARIENGLNYGAYYYDFYFGVEEGWPLVALAQWGQSLEAQIQAEVMLAPWNVDKKNYHHQYRNGLSSWYALEVARLTDPSGTWTSKILPTLLSNADWTIRARREGERSSLTRGLLPKHIYGGDVSTPVYSLYSNATCWRGLVETAAALERLGKKDEAKFYSSEANDFRMRLAQVYSQVLDRSVWPPFAPMALEFRDGKNERPYPRLTADSLGNYWNLFVPLILQTGLFHHDDSKLSSRWFTDYLETHGGLWAGLPRFYDGLDAVYAIGTIEELINRASDSKQDRIRALASIEAYMLHASSRNGQTIPEVSGLFNSRFDRAEFERGLKGSPWMFGVYDGGAYLRGELSMTEPLGAGAGEGLWLVRKALIDEGRVRETMQPNGELLLLSTVPANWLREGAVIELNRMPTAYGRISLKVVSALESQNRIRIAISREGQGTSELKSIRIRLVTQSGRVPVDALSPGSYDVDVTQYLGRGETDIAF